MPEYKLLVFSNPAAYDEAPFSEWYDAHVREVVRVEGVITAQRFRAVDAGRRRPPYRYLALADWRTDHLDAVDGALRSAVDTGVVGRAPAVDRPAFVEWLYEPMGPRYVE